MKEYKVNRKLVTVKCDYCNQEYEKPKSEYLRNIEVGRKSYCSRSCTGKANVKNLGDHRPTEHLKQYVKPLSPFGNYLRRTKKCFKEATVTLIDLEEQWNLQKGICPYSGVNLVLTNYKFNCKDKTITASLDRIDSNLGYIKGNIQWVSQCINFMKNTMTHEETLKVCKIIADFWNK